MIPPTASDCLGMPTVMFSLCFIATTVGRRKLLLYFVRRRCCVYRRCPISNTEASAGKVRSSPKHSVTS
jgi:hypothetical protein